MKPRRDYTDYLQDILEATTKAKQFVNDTDFESFRKNDEKVYAVIRALEIIGEAAGNVPRSIRIRYPEIPWKDIVGMRNKVIHAYFGVDLQVVWKTIHEDLSDLQTSIAKILTDLKREQDT